MSDRSAIEWTDATWNIQRRGLHLAMDKLEESQRAAEERRTRAAEEHKRNAESVAHSLHSDDKITPAFVSDESDTPARKSLPS